MSHLKTPWGDQPAWRNFSRTDEHSPTNRPATDSRIGHFSYKGSLPAYRITRGGVRHVVRATRYALALSLKGNWLDPDVFALHECDNPVCVRTSSAEELTRGLGAHLVSGDRRENMRRMARMRRGGGRRAILTRGAGAVVRAERSRAIRAAVADGWNAELVSAALLGAVQPTLW